MIFNILFPQVVNVIFTIFAQKISYHITFARDKKIRVMKKFSVKIRLKKMCEYIKVGEVVFK